ncbi:MAG: recombinase family protein [Catonella sp.]|nr:recombinase family protein [Catonella sp.]MDY6357772.1 recombinase family protein [Catonella sp.]
MMKYGYVRTSTKEQNLDRQIIAMKEAGIEEQYIFKEQKSGKDFDRQEYRKMMRRIKKGDALYIKSIDRLGRNYEEIIDQWKKITRDKKADIVVLDMPILNTSILKDSLKTFVSELVLQIMSYMAEEERKMILSRSREGIAAAKARGVKFGRPKKEKPEDFEEVYNAYKNQEITVNEAITRLRVSKSTFYRWKEEKEGF